MKPARYSISFGAFRPLLVAMGLGPRVSYLEEIDDDLVVKMGWGFSTRIPLESIRSVEPFTGLVGGIGVHGSGGRWLVNGAASGIVKLSVDPPARAKVVGFPVKLRELRVSLESPEQFISEYHR